MQKQSNADAGVLKKTGGTLFLITMTMMSMAGLVGTDVYLPMLPELGRELSESMESMQLTLSVYLLGLSIGQLFMGAISERFGRKHVLLISMSLYGLASVGCAMSGTLSELLFCRLLQSLGACGGLVIGRAIIGDLYEPQEAGKLFSTIFPFVGMSPAISPAIGGVIGHYWGWHANFLFIAIFAFAIVGLVLIKIPETLAFDKRKALHPLMLLTTYPKILFQRQFLAYAIAPCAAYMALFSYIAQSPYIFSGKGYQEQAIGLFYVTLSMTYLMGGFYSRRLLGKRSLNDILSIGYRFFVAGGVLIFICGFFNLPLMLMVASISVLTLGNGILIPLGTAGVVSSIREHIGYASGLLGFLQLGVAALTTSFIGVISLNQVNRLGLFICLITIFTSFLSRKLRLSSDE